MEFSFTLFIREQIQKYSKFYMPAYYFQAQQQKTSLLIFGQNEEKHYDWSDLMCFILSLNLGLYIIGILIFLSAGTFII